MPDFLNLRGYKTTEFWTTIATGVVIVLNSLLGWDLDSTAIVALVGSNAAFITNRQWHKATVAKNTEPPLDLAPFLFTPEEPTEPVPPVSG